MSTVLKRALLAVVIVVMLVGSVGCFGPGTSAPAATADEVENSIFELVNAERVSHGAEALTRNSDLDEIAEDYAVSGFTQESRYETNLIYLAHNAWQQEFPGSVRLDEDTAGEQVDFCISEQDMYDALLTAEAMETGVGVVIVDSIVYFAQVFDVINTKGADNEPIILVENPDAIDPTWEELVDFLEADTTDEIEYDWNAFICGDFAEAVHNSAEAAGIRAAFVPIRLKQEPGHAVNAFNVDGTIVFIDVINGDKVAYVKVGEDFGVIALDAAEHYTAEEFTYTYFETYVVLFEEWYAEKTAFMTGADAPEPYADRAEWFEAINEMKSALGIEGDTYFLPTDSLDTVDPNVAGYYVHW